MLRKSLKEYGTGTVRTGTVQVPVHTVLVCVSHPDVRAVLHKYAKLHPGCLIRPLLNGTCPFAMLP